MQAGRTGYTHMRRERMSCRERAAGGWCVRTMGCSSDAAHKNNGADGTGQTAGRKGAGGAAGRQTRRTAARQERYTDVTDRDPGCLRAGSCASASTGARTDITERRRRDTGGRMRARGAPGHAPARRLWLLRLRHVIGRDQLPYSRAICVFQQKISGFWILVQNVNTFKGMCGDTQLPFGLPTD